tara:strand:- start:2132 stop:2383 length:252 start_codon:yes stop_codon:yes gene_type:complete
MKGKVIKYYNYEMLVVMQEEFDSAEDAAYQLEASDKATLKEITDKKLMFSRVKLLKEEKADGLRSKENKEVRGSTGKGNQTNV